MTRDSLSMLVAELPELDAEAERRANYKINHYFPDCMPTCRMLLGHRVSGNPRHHLDDRGNQLYCRCLYRKHVAFMNGGTEHRERGMIAGNRVGKTELGAYETTLHLTGLYPHWWRGRRFSKAVTWWASGDTGKTTRNIIQRKLLGSPSEIGSGFIPRHLLVHRTKKSGVADAFETVWVKHSSGGMSTLEFKSYDQRREGFQGTAQHGIWLDEEPPMDIYIECVLRTMKTSDFPGGIIMLTFTPLKGRTVLVKQFMAEAVRLD